MSISNKHNHTTFTKSPPASLLHCIENILNHSSWKCRNFPSLMAALSFTKSIVQNLFTNITSATASLSVREKMISFSSHKSLWYSRKLRLLDN